MGRNSNFPGKPSKLVTKKRVSVLIGNHINNNSGIIGVSTASNGIDAQTNTNNDSNNAHLNDVSVQSSNNNSKLDCDIAIRSNATNSAKCDVVQANSPKEYLSGSSSQDDAPAKKSTKKKVSFKFGRETSDDAHIVKKEPNTNFAPPVSIIKKECLTRAIRIARGGESIIKPSVLSGLKILNNGANIDKLNSLTFKSQTSKFSSCKLSDAQSEESTEDQSDGDGDEGREKIDHCSSDEGSDEKNSQLKDDNDSDSTQGVPKRSVHSSRVIKPNKRFGDESKSFSSKNGMEKKKSSKTEVEGLNQPEIQKHEDERYVLKVSEHIKNNPFARIGDDIFGSSKSLLRQSKLQFASSTLSTSTSSTSKDNLFSTNATNASLNRNAIQLSNTVCCICGTAAPAAFTHKSRKYGSCCDSCNKYISKTLKKCCAKVDQLPPKILQCKKNDGNCSIAPIVPNIHHSFKAKKPCSACWLKKCIQSCRLTSEDRGRVLRLLPVSMKSIESKSFTSPFQSKPEMITDSTLSISNGLTSLFGNSLASARRLVSPWTSAKDGSETTEFRSFTSLSNPLSENNSKFGSSPQIVPNVLEKTAIMTSGISASLPPIATSNKKSQEIEELVRVSVKESVKETSTQTIDSKTVTRKALPEVAEALVEQEETSRLRLRKKDKQENVSTTCISTAASLTATITAGTVALGDTTKRQRIDLKGPRVKHVCRSASIVLGQPIATFGDENQILETLDTPPRPESPNGIVEFEGPIPSIAPNTECSDSTRLSPPATPIINDYDSESTLKDQSSAKSPGENSKSDDSSTASVDCIKRSDNDTKPVTRKLTRPNNTIMNGAPSVNNKKLNSFIRKPALKAAVKASPKISIDFWENYDPAEVSQRGFGLIFSEGVDIKALCFLCGSCGQDPLMFCVCCCEPYHEYCVEDKYNLKPHNSHDDTNASFMETSFLSGIGTLSSPLNKLNWLCPRCTTCYSCNMASGSKVKCQKCQKNYHPTCLGTSKRSSGADRPLICASCLKCKSCGTTKVSKFIGNMPMCTKCFESRQNGKYCPMCNKCYEENDFNIKMMECGDCNKWVHAKCEGLSDEKYNMLSVLPENIEFICRICRGKKNSKESSLNVINSMDQQIPWEAAVTAELKNGLLSVVKQLSKSRQACALLKLSPRKKPSTCGYCTQNQSRVRRNENDFEEYIEDPFDFAASLANESDSSSISNRCYCIKTSASSKPNTSQSLIDIKQKIIANEMYSLADFNYDMNLIISAAACDELMTAYKEILSEAFPWFQNETKACTDALEEDMYDSCNFDQTSMETNEVDQQVPMIDIPEDIDEYFYQPVPSNDTRICMFCKSCGDGYPAQESRLLYCGQNSWVHANCAMWSAEVFEEIDGSLQNVHSAISRGRMIKCSECGNKGATVGCNLRNCGEHYHFPCARRANCAFMSDKTVFCPQHSNNENRNSKAIRETNFEVLRPVYIELDRKRKRPVSPRKVQFLIGSLHVKQLGRFVPKLSDLSDAIVPAEFSCSRLYWSSKEPWKIVEYTIRTAVLSNFNIAMDMGRNFTVDHSSNLSKVQIGLAQITKWHSTLLNGDDHENVSRLERNAKLVNGHGEETNEEEPQTNADLLPPEIKDAIFEDLPHDILDGISMLDILPKLMYEDMMAMDTKNESSLTADSLRDNETDDEISQGSQKGFDNDNWTSTNMHAEDAMLSARSAAGALSRDVKRTKSELLGSRNHQRTANWSNKLDSALSAKRSRLTMLMSFRKTNEERSNVSEIKRQCKRSSEEIKDKSFTWSAAKRFTQLNNDIHPTDNDATKNRFKISQLDGMDDFDTDTRAQKSLFKCDRCHYTCRNQELFQRHLQSCEQQSSMRDSNSKTPDVQQQSIQSNVILTSVNGQDYCNLPIIQQNNQGQQIFGISGPNINQLAMQNSVQVNGQTIPLASIQNGSLPVQMQGMFINPNTGTIQSQQSHVFGQPLTLGALQQQVFPIQNLAQNAGNQAQTLSLHHATSQNIQYQPQIITCSSANTSQVLTVTPSQQQNIATSNYASIKTIQTQPTQLNRNTIILPQTDKNSPTKKQPIAKLQLSPGRTKGRITANVTPKTIQIKKSNQVIKTENNKTMAQITNTSLTNIRPNGATQLDNNNIVIQTTSTPTSNQPIIVQQVASANQGNLLQYVTSDGSNNGLQYFTMPTNDFKPQQPTQYLTPNPLIPGTFQLQTDNGNLLLANTATGLQVIPNNAFSQQPQVIGTIIQPQASTIQCGMMSSEQMVLGGTPSFDITNSLNGCMFLNSQPVYYGLETIVQNTVMQSQQFVSTAMQGVLSQNSSFSATTTQVFQASKIEPIMDMQQSYVVLNNDGTIMASQPQQPILTTTNLLQQAIPQLQNQTSQIQSAQNAGWRIIDDKSNVFTTNPTIIQTQPHTTAPQVHSNPISIQPQAQQQNSSQIHSIPSVSPQAQLQKVQPHKQITKSRQPKQPVASKQTGKPIVKSSPIIVNEIQSHGLKSDIDLKPQIVVLKSAEAFNIQKPPEITLRNDGNKKTHLTTTSSHEMKISAKIHPPTSQYVNQRKVSTSTPVVNGTKIGPVSVKPKIVGKGLHAEKALANQSNIHISIQKAIMSNPTSKTKVTTTESPNLGVIEQPIIKTIQSEILLSPDTPITILPNSNGSKNIALAGSANTKSNTSEISEFESPKLSQNKYEPIARSASPTKSSTKPSVIDTSPKVSISSSVTNTFNSQSTATQNSNLANQVQINFPVSNCIQLPTAPYAPLHANGIPTNVVNPIQQYHSGNRPMNRVLPMQTIQPKCSPTGIDTSESKSSVDIKSNLVKSFNDDQKSPLDSSFSSTSSLSSTPKLKIEEDPRMDEDMDIDEVDDFVNSNIEHEKENTEIKSEEMGAVISAVKDIDDSSNSTDFDSFKDSFLRGSSAEEVFDKLKKEEQINNSKFRTEEKTCESTTNDGNEPESDCKIDPQDQNLFDIPDSSEDATTVVTNVMPSEAEKVQSDEISNQKENIVPSIPATAISSSVKLLNQKMQISNKEFVAPKVTGPRLLYEIQSEDGFTYKSTSISEIWEKLFEAVQIARKAHGLSPLPVGPLADMCGYQMMGLKTNALKYLLEQLPGVERCSNYLPVYHKRAESTISHASSSGYWSDCDEMKENVNGTARCERFNGRSEYDMFGWLASRHRKQPVQICVSQHGIESETLVRRGSGSNLPMAMRYRTLKETYKDSVGVYRSHIHGRGLFCNRDIEAGEMVIEYAGELIRSTLTDKRERYYDSRGIGCYMFKIDDNLVVDATMRGNAARFINHSCEPNCYSKVVDILGHKHIIIFALRRIVQGEELTYDYKFPFEETKIPCSCGSRKCRKYLN